MRQNTTKKGKRERTFQTNRKKTQLVLVKRRNAREGKGDHGSKEDASAPPGSEKQGKERQAGNVIENTE